MSMTDVVTGLPNREYFDTVIHQEEERSRRHNIPLGVVLVEVRCPDATGSDKLAEVLREIGHLVKTNVRETDVVVRWDDMRLLVLMFDADAGSADSKASLLREKVQEFNAGTGAFREPVTVAVGAASHTPGAEFMRSLLEAESRLAADGGPRS